MQAQEKQKVKMSLMKQSGQMVTLTITSPNEFYIGGNTHVLYIGNKHFDLHDQNNIDGKGILKFYIPTDEFKKLTDGSKVYLSYGMLDADNELPLTILIIILFESISAIFKLITLLSSAFKCAAKSDLICIFQISTHWQARGKS
jgi:hypothetical protein